MPHSCHIALQLPYDDAQLGRILQYATLLAPTALYRHVWGVPGIYLVEVRTGGQILRTKAVVLR
ncbi:MAG: hypothetical protein FJY67_01665 [Calditrichaeota bacterium]|nr:hypothetical protein [Calditrichota bacterium]